MGKKHASPRKDHEPQKFDQEPEGSSDEEARAASPSPQLDQPTKSASTPKAAEKRGKRKSEQENQDSDTKRRKSVELESFPSCFQTSAPPKRKYQAAGVNRGSLPNIHARNMKVEKKEQANISTGTSFQLIPPPSSSSIEVKHEVFKDPPKFSLSTPKSLSRESSWTSPPRQTTKPSPKSTSSPFKSPPTVPTKSLGKNTRSVARTITPEPSKSLLDDTAQIRDILEQSSYRSPSPDDVIEVDRQCPTCSETVPEEMLAQWRAKYPKMTIRIQQQFCREHTLQSAKQSFEDRYPDHKSVIDVDWEKLNKRIEDLQGHMMWLIERPEKSFYRAEFERSVVNGGGSRTLMKQIIGHGKRNAKWDLNATGPSTAGQVSVGYYGTRGLKMMMDFITKNFSNALRERVGSDKLIAARDVSGYIQMVLAPEVAIRLIQDDMDVNDSRAREIMSDTAELGDQLHGSIDDTGQ